MGCRCTGGGFAVIPEQARQYDPIKFFLRLWYAIFWAFDGSVSNDSIVMGCRCTAGGFAVIPEQARQ